MTKLETLERRLEALEAEVAELRGKPRAGWLSRIIGSQADNPDFDEIVRLGKELRDAETFEDYDDTADESGGQGADKPCS